MPPGGTVTFLFTDIEGSTRLWENFPEPMKLAFARQESIQRDGILAHGGYPYKMIGDAFQAAFPSALDALNAAVALQRALAAEPWGETPICVRMALHTGVTEERGDDYVGPVLNRLARLLSTGHGGQTLLTQATADLLIDQLPDGVRLVDKGVHHLKDLVRPEHVYQVEAPGLPDDFPALKTIDGLPNNLPLQLTSFVGREKEMADLRALLTREETRLVTLTGPGGTGKTRLSLQIADELLETFPGGAWLVELAPITDPERIPTLIAGILNVHAAEDQLLLTSIIDALRSKKTLLILDNCEHMVEACASLASQLLSACPGLLVLASSREILGIGGEFPFRVPSLSMPDARVFSGLESLAQSEAVTLFVERAQAVAPSFRLSEDNAADVAQIVRRLDGIPLAIELAAARVRMLNPHQIAARLNDAFRLLTGGSRTVLPRHQTLQALIDWSYNLLAAKERALLRRLSVFSGDWTLEDAEAVCPDPLQATAAPELDPGEILDVLTQLADKSMVVSIPEAGQDTRFRMMETIHQYAHEKLATSGESPALRERHLAYFLDLAEQGEPFLRTSQQVLWMNRLESMQENLRRALEWGLEQNVVAELRLAAALMWFWHIRGLASEGIQWLRQGLSILEAGGAAPAGAPEIKVRAKALLALGALVSEHERPANAVPLLEESLSLYQAMGPTGRPGVANCYRWLANSANRMHDSQNASLLAGQAMQIFRDQNDLFGQSECLMILAGGLENAADCTSTYLQVLDLKRRIGDVDGIAFCLQYLALRAAAEGDFQRASSLLDESLARFRQVGNRRFTVIDLQNKASLHWTQGNYELALQWTEEAIGTSSSSGDNRQYLTNLLRKGDIFLSAGDVEAGSQVYVEALRIAQETADRRMEGGAQAALGSVEALCGRLEQAARRFETALAIAQPAHYRPLILITRLKQGKLADLQGDLARAERLFDECLKQGLEMKDLRLTAITLLGLAGLAVRRGDPAQAARLFGAANRRFRLIENMLPRAEQAQVAQNLADARAALGQDGFAGCWEAGVRLTDEQLGGS